MATNYRTLRARALKASEILDHAKQHLVDRLLTAYPDFTPPYAEDLAVMDADDVFKAASERLWAEVDAARKQEGIGVYQPYGRKSVPFSRR
jgi:hypothetical protein